MIENLGRKLTTIFVLLLSSILLLTLQDRPFNLGLDLQGGTRMTLRIDWDEAIEQEVIDPNEDKLTVLNQMISIFRDRIDPNGTLEPILRTEGQDRIVIELPGRAGGPSQNAVGALATDLSIDGNSLVLADAGGDFPAEGGVVKIEGEDVRYERRTELNAEDDADELAALGLEPGTYGKLIGLQRGAQSTERVAHGAATSVRLVSTNQIRNAIENLGNLAFTINADAADLVPFGTDLTTERTKLEEWLVANPEAQVVDFNKVAAETGGPSEAVRWYVSKDDPDNSVPQASRAVPVLNMPALGNEDWVFSGEALAQAYLSQDGLGRPAVGFRMKPHRVGDFTRFTEEHVNRLMSIVLNGVIESSANINGVLPGSGQIEGEFTIDYVNTLITVLRTGSLKIKPDIISDERVGATLGDEYVRKGLVSCLIAIFAVIVFVAMYYRRLGLYAGLALLCTLLMLMGSLSFLQATLTLPGVAGIILTVGMAVDANILIFDRLREEMDKGRNIKQASKNGFSRAAITIFDANLTTLITAAILFNVGTGPVKGFAVTLMIGVLTSMFSALVITKVMVHTALEKGMKGIHVGTWFVTAAYKFMDKAKPAMAGSLVLILAGLGLFASLDDKQKLSIDFLGGATMQIVTAQPQTVERVRELVAAIEGDIGGSEVKPVLSEADQGDTYSAFRITFKTDQLEDADADTGASFKEQVSVGLEEILLSEPIVADVAEGSENAEVFLYFGEPHDEALVAGILETAGLREVSVTPSGTGSFKATGLVLPGTTDTDLAENTRTAFLDAGSYTLAEPVPDYSEVGSQVVGELRDKAILAILVSLFAIVMYIRVRFAEYSYGFAAVAAVIHDVMITLGVLSVFMLTGLVNVEISVALIAAFLTIIGYSLNDTIVLFDRVRENLPRMETSLDEILNTSINQTLSRTVLTSVTTLVAVLILFVFNLGTGNVLEGFALTMVIGVLVGTYSSIFIASPVLLILEKRAAKKRAALAAAAAAELAAAS